MRYEIQYKVKAVRHGGWLFSKSNLFPTLSIRYRKGRSRKWVHLGKAEIDLYTYRRFQSSYYKDFKKGATYMTTLESRSDYERLELFMTILDNEFNGSVKELVRSIVREDVVMEKAEHAECEDADHIATALATGKRAVTSVQI